jgi:protease-4
MSIDWEIYEERRRKNRRSGFWRGVLSSFIVFLVLILVYSFYNNEDYSSEHIAIYDLNGVIYDDSDRDKVLKEISENENVFGLIVRINSPGGTVVGAESLYESLRAVSKQKPVVITMGEIAASAGYLAAIAGDFIIARGNSLTGSIGVIVQFPNFAKLAKNLGISLEEIKSAESKGGPNPFDELSPNVRKFQENLVDDSYTWFKSLVSERRGLSLAELSEVSKGQLFTGRMALSLGLIDAIGGINEAILYFESKGTQFKDLEIKNWTRTDESTPFWTRFLGIANVVSSINQLFSFSGPALFSIVS